MTTPADDEPKNVRLLFELSRADNPALYDELVRFPQGQKRVNRLRLLAYQGYLSQFDGFSFTRRMESGLEIEPSGPSPVTNDVFGPSLAE